MNITKRFLLIILKSFAFDMHISNPCLDGSKLFLNWFWHKNYWISGKKRESKTIEFFNKKIQRHWTVFDIGGHIGQLTQVFANSDQSVNVTVFEPDPKNIKYLNKNISQLKNVELIQKGVSEKSGILDFYTVGLGGFMNSFSKDFIKASDVLKSYFFLTNYQTVKVNVITLDEYCANKKTYPDFLKIDVEGHELSVLHGATHVLTHLSALAIEVTQDKKEIIDLLIENGFKIVDIDTLLVNSNDNTEINLFAEK